MSVGQSTSPGLERASDRRELTEVLGRVEQLERVPAAPYLPVFGSWHQQIPLRHFGSGAPIWDTSGYAWVNDATVPPGGYIGATTDASFFTCLVLLAPKGSVWQINVAANDGPDFGRFKYALASLVYQPTDRPSGDPSGKISPVDGSYGSFTYVDVFSGLGIDRYAAVSTGNAPLSSSIPFIVGGDEGDPLTTVAGGTTDPLTGFKEMDGGPGWYRLKVYTTGKNSSSSGFKVQISDLLLTRRADDNHP